MDKHTKAQFFSQNLGCYVWDNRDGEFDISKMCWVLSKADLHGNIWVRHEMDDVDHKLKGENKIKHFSLVKSALYEITDEHAFEVSKFMYLKEWIEKVGKDRIVQKVRGEIESNRFIMNLEKADFLRPLDYAIIWNGISVEQQVESGLIVLRGGVRG